MQDWIQVVVLALVQGLTEFLPVSSSAHLILIPELLGWQDQGLGFDIAVHIGTLFAVILYFKQDLGKMTADFFQSFTNNKPLSVSARIGWGIGFATIPVGLTGLMGRHFIEEHLRSPFVIALTTILFGLLLWYSEKRGKQQRSLDTLHWQDVGIIGIFQALSLIPGASRSGVTLSAGLLRGLTRAASARFSFLLSIPVILLAGSLELFSVLNSDIKVDWMALGVGAIISGLSGYGCIHYFLKLLDKVGLFPFVLYRLLLGVYLILHFY